MIIASEGFAEDIDASAVAFGMEAMQYVMVPHVYNNIGEEEARSQTEPVFDEVVRMLTGSGSRPASHEAADGSAGGTYRVTAATEAEALEELNRQFMDADWGDGFPLWPPTPRRVAALVDAVDGDRDDVVCVLPPGNGFATVEKVAVNAAMAGCRPAEMPVVMAALRALARMDSPLARVCLMSTSSHAPLLLINGPVTRELGINGGRGCLGPGKQNQANLRIARAFLLCLKNIGRWYPGIMDLDTIGSARKLGMCLAENEEESPWEGFHESVGFGRHESTVTVMFTSGDWDIKFQGHTDAQQLARAIAANISGLGTFGYFTNLVGGVHQPEEGMLLLLAPPHAVPLAEGGFTKGGLRRFLQDHAREPVSRLIEPLRKLEEEGKIKPEWQWLFELSPEEAARTTLPLVESPEVMHVAVAGSVRGCDLLMPVSTRPGTARVVSTPQEHA